MKGETRESKREREKDERGTVRGYRGMTTKMTNL